MSTHELMPGVPESVGRKPLSRLQGLKCRRAAAVKARDQLQPTSAQSPIIKTTSVARPSELSVSNAGGEDGGWVPLWYGWWKAVEWGGRPWSGVENKMFYAMKLMLTGNDTERKMPALPARSRSAKTLYLTAAAFFLTIEIE